jgi:hypothetical protein
MGINGDAHEHVGENDASEEAGEQAASEDNPIPGYSPARTLMQATELEGGTAQDQGKENAEHFQIKAAKHSCIPVGECCEKCASGSNQPDLIPIPEWPN